MLRIGLWEPVPLVGNWCRLRFKTTGFEFKQCASSLSTFEALWFVPFKCIDFWKQGIGIDPRVRETRPGKRGWSLSCRDSSLERGGNSLSAGCNALRDPTGTGISPTYHWCARCGVPSFLLIRTKRKQNGSVRGSASRTFSSWQRLAS